MNNNNKKQPYNSVVAQVHHSDGYSKTRYKRLQLLTEIRQKRSDSAREQRLALYRKAINSNNNEQLNNELQKKRESEREKEKEKKKKEEKRRKKARGKRRKKKKKKTDEEKRDLKKACKHVRLIKNIKNIKNKNKNTTHL